MLHTSIYRFFTMLYLDYDILSAQHLNFMFKNFI